MIPGTPNLYKYMDTSADEGHTPSPPVLTHPSSSLPGTETHILRDLEVMIDVFDEGVHRDEEVL